MSVLITGGKGQLGSELKKLLDEQQIAYVAYDSKELDITDAAAVEKTVEKIKPAIIYHCAAYTAVDTAEDEGKDMNQSVNVIGTKNIAKAAESIGAVLVYISTDYVFDGTSQGEYKEEDPTNPQNEYGRAKLAGEQMVQKYTTKHYIIRTSWVFGEFGKNFVCTMQNLAKNHAKLTVVSDQVGRPTWTRTLAEFMVFLTEKEADYGVYHLSNDESCSWYEFAKEILKEENVEVVPVTSAEYPQKANRPKHSIMSLEKTKATGFNIITWKEALAAFHASLIQ
ncbi:dTDP-4-dehydrorhamnose reductase [Carnobacterium mobile]|uniref:dTDP-4-dehydrorhamnose reductase n=1 Tax=Carnobacterium mobile TaxID=2750 RepID=UPI001866D551|nr:dTDP-4-dehydrorhamnose reductase [Carnobacterium mobile]